MPTIKHLFEFDQRENNAVQEQYYNMLKDLFEKNHDDLQDNANFIKALTKFTEDLKKETAFTLLDQLMESVSINREY